MKQNHDLRISVPVQWMYRSSLLSFSTYPNRFQKTFSLPSLSIQEKNLSSSQDTASLGTELESWCWAGWQGSRLAKASLAGCVYLFCHLWHLQNNMDIILTCFWKSWVLPNWVHASFTTRYWQCYEENIHLPGRKVKTEYLTFSCCNPFWQSFYVLTL